MSSKSPSKTAPSKERASVTETRVPSKSRTLIIYNRATLHSYLCEELTQYYELVGLQDLDFQGLKDVRRSKMKVLLQREDNLKKAIDVLVETDANRNIKSLMKEYESSYKKFQ